MEKKGFSEVLGRLRDVLFYTKGVYPVYYHVVTAA